MAIVLESKTGIGKTRTILSAGLALVTLVVIAAAVGIAVLQWSA